MKRTSCFTTPKSMIIIFNNMEFHTTFKKQIILVRNEHGLNPQKVMYPPAGGCEFHEYIRIFNNLTNLFTNESTGFNRIQKI